MSMTQVLLIFPKKINHDFYTTYKEEGLLLLLKKKFLILRIIFITTREFTYKQISFMSVLAKHGRDSKTDHYRTDVVLFSYNL